MQNPESSTAAERPSLLTVKNIRYVGSIEHELHSFQVAEVQGYVRDGKSVVDLSIGSTSRELTLSEARAIAAAISQAIEALS